MSDKAYFDKIAQQWDRLRESFFSEKIREKAFSLADVQEGKIAADIGAGSGFITEGLIGRGLKVIAVDQSEVMLNEMKKKFSAVDNIEYRLGESQNLPLENESVDYVFGNMYLHHVESPPDAVKEMVRILKPSGKLIITDLDEHDYKFLLKEHNDRWMGFNRENIRKWFMESELRNVIVDCAGENCCSQSECGNENASISIFIAMGIK